MATTASRWTWLKCRTFLWAAMVLAVFTLFLLNRRVAGEVELPFFEVQFDGGAILIASDTLQFPRAALRFGMRGFAALRSLSIRSDSSGRNWAIVPLWPVLLFLCCGATYSFIQDFRCRPKDGFCICGYRLSGTAECRCPECGRVASSAAQAHRLHTNQRNARIGCTVLALSAVASFGTLTYIQLRIQWAERLYCRLATVLDPRLDIDVVCPSYVFGNGTISAGTPQHRAFLQMLEEQVCPVANADEYYARDITGAVMNTRDSGVQMLLSQNGRVRLSIEDSWVMCYSDSQPFGFATDGRLVGQFETDGESAVSGEEVKNAMVAFFKTHKLRPRFLPASIPLDSIHIEDELGE